jgi:molybdopterin-guanine dinucleotide biosynthesis protein MobB
VVGIVGRSGSGKTSLLTHLIPALTARGLAVGAVKHSSHGFLADRPGKDSYRLYESGAQAVALVSAEQRATFTRLPCRDSEPSLAEALTSLPDGLDLVLAEGFSWEPIPRLVVVPGSDAPLRKHFEHGEVLRVVRVPKPAPGEQPAIARQLIESIALELVGLAHERRRTLECTPSTSVAPAWLRS